MRDPIPLFLLLFIKECITEETFVNYHDSIDVGGPFEKLFRPANNVPNTSFQSQDFYGGLQELHDILAQSSGARVRAFGSQWSLSNVAYTRDVAIATDRLTYARIGIGPGYVDPAYETTRDQLVFCQTGVKIKALSQALKQVGLSLTTTGGSDGQTIGGALGTGTHGSDSLNGAMPSFVRGMHFVLSETKHVFVQRSSDPVVTSSFVDWISENSTTPALFLADDSMFDACLIHLGSMGLLHAVVLQAEPWFALQTQFKVFHYEDIKDVLSSLDVGKLNFDRPGHITDPNQFPYHLSVSINPYKSNKSYIGLYDKLPIAESSDRSRIIGAAVQSKDIFETVMEQIDFFFVSPLQWLVRLLFVHPFANVLKRFIYGILLARGANDYYSRQASNSGRGLSEIFTFSAVDSFPFPTTNLEAYVSSDKATEVVDIFLDIVKRRVLISAVNLRYIKPSVGTLGSARFGPLTASIDLFGPWDDWLFADTEEIFEEVFASMAARKDDIPHCWHWGKKLPNDNAWVNWCLGPDKEAWIDQRKILLDEQQQEMFANEYLESLGLYGTSM